MKSHKKAVPMLWRDEAWVTEFLEFVRRFVGDGRAPRCIEVHPPFREYCAGLDRFTAKL